MNAQVQFRLFSSGSVQAVSNEMRQDAMHGIRIFPVENFWNTVSRSFPKIGLIFSENSIKN